jgi:hypothetical protein
MFTLSQTSMIFSSETSFTVPPIGSVCFQNLLRCLAPLLKISEVLSVLSDRKIPVAQDRHNTMAGAEPFRKFCSSHAFTTLATYIIRGP